MALCAIFRYEQAGAGGWGDPLERGVLAYVRNEYISGNAARSGYDVVVDPTKWAIDEQATAKLRSRLRRERNWKCVPFVDRGLTPDVSSPLGEGQMQ